MSRSLAARIAKLERRLREMSERKDVQIAVKDFAQPAPAQERTEATYALHACLANAVDA